MTWNILWTMLETERENATKNTPRLSVFDYIKSIGYYMEIVEGVPVKKVA